MKGLPTEMKERHIAALNEHNAAYYAYAKAKKQIALNRIEKYEYMIEKNKGKRIVGVFENGIRQAEALVKEANFMLTRI